MSQNRQTLTASGTYLLNTAGQNVTPDGVALQFTETGTQSLVLAVNTAPPGSAVSLTNIPYLNGSLVSQSAGTAITATGIAYIAAQYAALDIYGVLTSTSGSLVVQSLPWNSGAPEGAISAADVTAGAFGANTGDVGDYVFPDDVTVTDTIQATDVLSTAVSVGGVASAARSFVTTTKAVTGIANNVATTVLTITVPNAAHSATVRVTAIGVLGAGGAIGAGEANASNSYDITVVRTVGVNAVADISTAYGVNAANVAGAATCTAALTVGSVSGAVGAVNTFPVQITIVRSGGSSDNHTAVLTASVLNQNDGGVTIA